MHLNWHIRVILLPFFVALPLVFFVTRSSLQAFVPLTGLISLQHSCMHFRVPIPSLYKAPGNRTVGYSCQACNLHAVKNQEFN